MKCLGIIWNSIYEFKDEILEDLKKYVVVEHSFSLDLSDEYENFVRTLYSFDEIADWKVDKKIETMFANSDDRKIGVVLFNVNTDNVRYHEFKKRNVYSDLEDLKVLIRNKYSKKIPIYFFDNIFHATDDEKEFEQDYKLVNSYINSCLINEAEKEKTYVKSLGEYNESKR